MVGLVFFMVGYSVGFATVPFVLLGEMLPAKFRSTLGSAATAWNLTNTFLVIKASIKLSPFTSYTSHCYYFLF